MSQPKNSTTATPTQLPRPVTRSLEFCIGSGGASSLAVKAGAPAEFALQTAGEVLDGLGLLIDRFVSEEESACNIELRAFHMLVEIAGSLVIAARRGMDAGVEA